MVPALPLPPGHGVGIRPVLQSMVRKAALLLKRRGGGWGEMEIVKLHVKNAIQDTTKTMFEHVSKALDKALALGKTLDETHVSWTSW